MSICYCEDLYHRPCAHCEARAEKEENHRVCESWNWNCSPRECAEEASELGWRLHRIKQAMSEFGFSQREIANVVREFESLD